VTALLFTRQVPVKAFLSTFMEAHLFTLFSTWSTGKKK
jgi:hypothetical protein